MKEAQKHRARASSDVSPLRALFLAVPLYALVVFAADAMPAYFRQLLLERGLIPHVIVALSAWALAILALKAWGLRAQRRAFALELLPKDEPRISPDNVGRFLEHIESLRTQRATRRVAKSFLLERVSRILEHYAARGDVAETAAVSQADGDADAASIASSFSMVKVLVWAIPILGFIGTVVGIGAAVGGFSQSLEGAEQLDTIKTSLGNVTSGLAVAFDTTLVALVASILVMVPTSWVQKAEERLVDEVDDHCVTHVLRRLVTPGEPLRDVVVDRDVAERPVVDAAAIELLVARAVAAPLGEVLSAHARLLERLTEDHDTLCGAQGSFTEQLSSFAVAAKELGPSVKRAARHLERATEAMGRATTLAERATDGAARTEAQLCRELGASRQLLSLLAAGMPPSLGDAHPSDNTNGRARHDESALSSAPAAE